MLHIVCRSQEGIGSGASCDPVRLEFPDKQQHLAPSLLVMDIPLAGGRVRRRGALALPVEQVFVDGVVVVHGGGRIVLVSLVQRHKEHIQLVSCSPLMLRSLQ